MRIGVLLATIVLASCGSNTPMPEARLACPEAVVQQRARDVQSADVVVVGQWQLAEPDLTPEIGVKIGFVKASKIVQGTLESDSLIGLVTGDIKDPKGQIVQCGLTEPSTNEVRVFYIRRGESSFQIIDHLPNVEN